MFWDFGWNFWQDTTIFLVCLFVEPSSTHLAGQRGLSCLSIFRDRDGHAGAVGPHALRRTPPAARDARPRSAARLLPTEGDPAQRVLFARSDAVAQLDHLLSQGRQNGGLSAGVCVFVCLFPQPHNTHFSHRFFPKSLFLCGFKIFIYRLRETYSFFFVRSPKSGSMEDYPWGKIYFTNTHFIDKRPLIIRIFFFNGVFQ